MVAALQMDVTVFGSSSRARVSGAKSRLGVELIAKSSK